MQILLPYEDRTAYRQKQSNLQFLQPKKLFLALSWQLNTVLSRFDQSSPKSITCTCVANSAHMLL